MISWLNLAQCGCFTFPRDPVWGKNRTFFLFRHFFTSDVLILSQRCFFLSLFYCLQLSYSRLVVVKVIQCRAKRTGCPQYVQIWSHTPTLGKQMKHWHRARESLEFALQLHGSKCNGVCKREAKAKKRSLYFRWRQRRKCQIEKNIKKKIKCMGGNFKKAE